jgi:hypothetical protein
VTGGIIHGWCTVQRAAVAPDGVFGSHERAARVVRNREGAAPVPRINRVDIQRVTQQSLASQHALVSHYLAANDLIGMNSSVQAILIVSSHAPDSRFTPGTLYC